MRGKRATPTRLTSANAHVALEMHLARIGKPEHGPKLRFGYSRRRVEFKRSHTRIPHWTPRENTN